MNLGINLKKLNIAGNNFGIKGRETLGTLLHHLGDNLVSVDISNNILHKLDFFVNIGPHMNRLSELIC